MPRIQSVNHILTTFTSIPILIFIHTFPIPTHHHKPHLTSPPHTHPPKRPKQHPRPSPNPQKPGPDSDLPCPTYSTYVSKTATSQQPHKRLGWENPAHDACGRFGPDGASVYFRVWVYSRWRFFAHGSGYGCALHRCGALVCYYWPEFI